MSGLAQVATSLESWAGADGQCITHKNTARFRVFKMALALASLPPQPRFEMWFAIGSRHPQGLGWVQNTPRIQNTSKETLTLLSCLFFQAMLCANPRASVSFRRCCVPERGVQVQAGSAHHLEGCFVYDPTRRKAWRCGEDGYATPPVPQHVPPIPHVSPTLPVL